MWWKILIFVLLAIVFWAGAYIYDPYNSFFYRLYLFNKVKIGDKVSKSYDTRKRMEDEQRGHVIYGIVVDKIDGGIRDKALTVEVYFDDEFLYKETLHVFFDIKMFWGNWRLLDDYNGIINNWIKHYKGDPWY